MNAVNLMNEERVGTGSLADKYTPPSNRGPSQPHRRSASIEPSSAANTKANRSAANDGPHRRQELHQYKKSGGHDNHARQSYEHSSEHFKRVDTQKHATKLNNKNVTDRVEGDVSYGCGNYGGVATPSYLGNSSTESSNDCRAFGRKPISSQTLIDLKKVSRMQAARKAAGVNSGVNSGYSADVGGARIPRSLPSTQRYDYNSSSSSSSSNNKSSSSSLSSPVDTSDNRVYKTSYINSDLMATNPSKQDASGQEDFDAPNVRISSEISALMDTPNCDIDGFNLVAAGCENSHSTIKSVEAGSRQGHHNNLTPAAFREYPSDNVLQISTQQRNQAKMSIESRQSCEINKPKVKFDASLLRGRGRGHSLANPRIPSKKLDSSQWSCDDESDFEN